MQHHERPHLVLLSCHCLQYLLHGLQHSGSYVWLWRCRWWWACHCWLLGLLLCRAVRWLVSRCGCCKQQLQLQGMKSMQDRTGGRQ